MENEYNKDLKNDIRVDSWEGNDIITKLLKEQASYENRRSSCLTEKKTKSLHDELAEVGEYLHQSVDDASQDMRRQQLSKKPLNLQSFMMEFNTLNQIVERSLSHSSCCSKSNSQSSCCSENNNQSSCCSENNSQSSCCNENISQSLESGTRTDIRPPPGFENKVPNKSFNLNLFINDFQNETDKPFEIEIKSQSLNIRRENVEFDQKKTECTQQFMGPPYALNKTTNDFLGEFNHLSNIMDKELSCYASNLQIMREQKQSVNDQMKNQEKLEMLTEQLQEQKAKMKSDESEYKKNMRAVEKKLKNELNRLQKITRENNATSRTLQNEFNKALNERESEIGDLYAQIDNLQATLKSYDSETAHIAMENEELSKTIQNKDKYITSLLLQNTNHKKMMDQNEWKLQQADDLLEMVEDEQDKIETAAKKIIIKLQQELKKERGKNEQLMESLQGINNKPKTGSKQTEKYYNIIELEKKTREKLMKMAHRSSSGRRTCIVKHPGNNEVPTVLVSLGWITSSNKKQ